MARLTRRMTATMTLGHGTSLETRSSLLNRLKSGDDAQSWHEFYRTYGGLLRFFATKAGLTADEAEEVVQETAIGVARRVPPFIFDPKGCRFKNRLLKFVHLGLQGQFRRGTEVGQGYCLVRAGQKPAPPAKE